jgi:hypothetical protein
MEKKEKASEPRGEQGDGERTKLSEITANLEKGW